MVSSTNGCKPMRFRNEGCWTEHTMLRSCSNDFRQFFLLIELLLTLQLHVLDAFSRLLVVIFKMFWFCEVYKFHCYDCFWVYWRWKLILAMRLFLDYSETFNDQAEMAGFLSQGGPVLNKVAIRWSTLPKTLKKHL